MRRKIARLQKTFEDVCYELGELQHAARRAGEAEVAAALFATTEHVLAAVRELRGVKV